VRWPSLRWRLALLSSVLAGGVLVGFALLSSLLIYQAKVERLDARLESLMLPLGRLRDGAIPPNLETDLAQALGLASPEALAMQIIGPGGTMVYQSPQWPTSLRLEGQRLEVSPRLTPPAPGQSAPQWPRRQPRAAWLQRQTQRTPQGRWRVTAMVTPLGNQVAIAVNLRSLQQEMTAIRSIYLITIPGALLLIAGGAWWLSGSALVPIHRLSQMIRQVTVQGLDQRVPTAHTDGELVELITVFNAMLERLERSFRQASRFSGDAAHELKTPLAILQGELEQAIQQVEIGSPWQQTLSQLLAEVRRLSSIVRKLLLLSLADAGQMSLHRQSVNLSRLLQEQVEDLPLLAPDLDMESYIAPDLRVSGDPDLLVQLLQNLLSNAVKYNLPRGWVRVQCRPQGNQVQVTIANATQGLATGDGDRLFERFYRGDAARSRTTDGLGLGLSLSQEIARAHSGDLRLSATRPGVAEFTLTLPILTLEA
jgi:two-component system heavy metal sensor histidine kinase CusS